MGLLMRLRSLSAGEAVILLADLAINTGFFMLIPYISIHVKEDLGLTATVAGTVLAVRMGVQQVLMMLAGPVADLYGYKRMLIVGLLIRSIGFTSFAFMGDLSGLLLSAVLSGMGGALFSSAERAAYAALGSEGADQGARFALLYSAQSAGSTLGPLVGALLLSVDFRLLSLVAGFVYLPIAALVFFLLPNLTSGRVAPAPAEALGEVVRSVWLVSRNRAFVAYCLISAGFWTISGQINISLSLYAAATSGNQASVKYLLLTSSILVILLQYRIQQWAHDKGPALVRWAVGSIMSGLAFLLLLPFPDMRGLMATVVLVTLGGMLLRPVDYQMVVDMSPRNALASYYGFSALAVALGGSTGQFLGGRLTDLAATTGFTWLPWVTFAVLGVSAGLVMLGWGRGRLSRLAGSTP